MEGKESGLVLITNGKHKIDIFEATTLKTRKVLSGYKGEHWKRWSKEAFKLCTQPITIKND